MVVHRPRRQAGPVGDLAHALNVINQGATDSVGTVRRLQELVDRALSLATGLSPDIKALVADHLIIVGRGRVLADTTVQDLVRTGPLADVGDLARRRLDAAFAKRQAGLQRLLPAVLVRQFHHCQ